MAFLTSADSIESGDSVAANVSATFDSGETGSNRLLMIALMYENGGDPNISAITYNGEAMTKEDTITVSPSDDFSETIEVWYLVDPATGSNTIQLTNDATDHDFYLYAAVYTGRDQTTPILSANTVSAARPLSDDGTLTITKPSEDDEIFWAIVQDRGGDTEFVAESNNTIREQFLFGSTGGDATTAIGDRLTGSGSVTVGATNFGTGSGSTQDLAVIAVVMQPASTTVSGSGDLQATAATTDGAGVMGREASGTLQAGQATAMGDGDVGGATGEGTLQAGQATTNGVAAVVKTASGALQAGQATTDGEGVLERTASGALQAGQAAVGGDGVVSGAISGSGALQAARATSAGEGVKGKIATAAMQAETAAVVGIGVRTVTGQGVMAAATATAYGYTWAEQPAAPGVWTEQPGPTN